MFVPVVANVYSGEDRRVTYQFCNLKVTLTLNTSTVDSSYSSSLRPSCTCQEPVNTLPHRYIAGA